MHTRLGHVKVTDYYSITYSSFQVSWTELPGHTTLTNFKAVWQSCLGVTLFFGELLNYYSYHSVNSNTWLMFLNPSQRPQTFPVEKINLWSRKTSEVESEGFKKKAKTKGLFTPLYFHSVTGACHPKVVSISYVQSMVVFERLVRLCWMLTKMLLLLLKDKSKK